MAKIFIFITTLFLVSQGLAQSVLTMRSDKPSYTQGEKAVLLLSAKPLVNPDTEEYVAVSEFEALALRTIALAENEFAAISPALNSGTVTWAVSVYKQNKIAAREISGALQLEKKTIRDLQKLLRGQTDPDNIADLQAAIQNSQDQIVVLQGQLAALRTLVESKNLSFSVTSTKLRSRAIMDSLELATDRLNNSAVLGESVRVTMTVRPEHFGVSEPMLSDLTAKFMGQSVLASRLDLSTYYFDVDTTIAGLGTHTFESSLFIKDKAAFNSIDNAVRKAGIRKLNLGLLKDSTLNEALSVFYLAEINDLDGIMDALVGVQFTMRNLIATKSLNLIVTEPNPVVISHNALETMEGHQNASYTVIINREPTSDVTLSISSTYSGLVFSDDGVNWSSTLNLIYTLANWTTPKEIFISVPDNSIADGDRQEYISNAFSGGGYDNITVQDIEVTIKDPTTELVCSPSSGYIYSYWGSDYYDISLPYPPSEPTTVTVSQTSGFMLNGNMAGMSEVLSFDSTNWDIPQTIGITVDSSWWISSGFYPFDHSFMGDTSYTPCGYGVEFSEY
ncbi:type IV secretion system protein [Bdellovibrio bacteriovorus]|uniref:type IV secretion system protein n=1 Tax=Bdellovibrio bacteriovorus TaxID=959 RepID=UPI0021CED4CB|nr:type IV secretion system protein [Bdellovibrio bacteriovorus]UXR63263.1 type IV secretion system protein [Bdellovibrio bacteriovorus]